MDRYVSTIQLIIKARKYTLGDSLLDAIRFNKVSLVILASDAGKSNYKKIMDKCRFYKIECIPCLTKELICSLFNKDISSFGITDINLANKLKENLKLGGKINETNI